MLLLGRLMFYNVIARMLNNDERGLYLIHLLMFHYNLIGIVMLARSERHLNFEENQVGYEMLHGKIEAQVRNTPLYIKMLRPKAT